jgi:hypothetical protein
MFKHSRRHVFASLAVALALTGCAPEPEMEAPVPAVKEEGGIGKTEQGVSVIPGYDVELWTGTYTQRGYIMPRWTAPSNHSQTDWLGLYKAGAATPNDAYLNFQHVANKGRTTQFGSAIRVPATLPTTDSYEVRYQTDNTFNLAARSTSFRVKATPTLACASATFSGDDLPTAHFVNLGKSSGQVAFSFNMYSVKDRLQVWTDDDRLLFDSGCVAVSRNVTLNDTYPNNRLLVLSLPSCDITSYGGTGYDWTMGCPP